jgi:limonene-1,2-epoxide hydrolase
MSDVEAIVTEWLEAIQRDDLDAAMALAVDDVIYHNIMFEPLVGQKDVRATLRLYLDNVEKMEWEVLRQFAFGNVVINERVDRFLIDGQWVDLPVAGVFELNDAGKITLWRDYFDWSTYTSGVAKIKGA